MTEQNEHLGVCRRGSQSPAPPWESHWLWVPGQSEAWTLELLQDDLALQVVGELVHAEELAVIEGGQVVDVDLPGLREGASGEPCGPWAPRAHSQGQPAGLRPHHQEERTGLWPPDNLQLGTGLRTAA